MTTLSYPAMISQAFASGSGPNFGGKNTIPMASAAPAASFADGFPNVTMLPLLAGGVPPSGQDMNGILNAITQHTAWVNAGGNYLFNSALAAAIVGYPQGMTLQSNDLTLEWTSLCSGNSADPNAGPFAITASCLGSVLTVTATAGVLLVGQQIVGAGIPVNAVISSLGTGTGGSGTYNLSKAAPSPVSGESMTAFGWAPWVGSYLPMQGTVPRGQADKNQDLISVFEWFTPAQIADVRAGTMTLDVSGAINTAMLKCVNQGLFFPAGTYGIANPLNYQTAQRLRGVGYGTIIRCMPSWNPSIPTLTPGIYTPVLAHAPMLYNSSGIQWGQIENMTFDGNGQNCYGIYLMENFYCRAKDVLVMNTNYRPYTNIRGQAILNDNVVFYGCGDGALSYDCSNLKWLSCGFEQLKGNWSYDHWCPNNKGQVTLDSCWFEDQGAFTPTLGFLRLDGRGARAKIHSTLSATYTSQILLSLHANTDTQTVDGIAMTSVGATFGEFFTNQTGNAMAMFAGVGSNNNKIGGFFTSTNVTDNGTANTWDYSAFGLIGQGFCAPFVIRTPAGAGLPISASSYLLWADNNAGNPILHLLGNSNHALLLNSGVLQLKSNNGIQLNPTGAVNNADIVCLGTNGAFYPPALTTTQQAALTGGDGSLIFNNTLHHLMWYSVGSGSWIPLGTTKNVANNGSTTTYTIPGNQNFNYITTTAASLAITFPAAAAALDGMQITVVLSAAVGTVTWSSAGATFAGAPAAGVANTPYRFIYHSATTQWLPC